MEIIIASLIVAVIAVVFSIKSAINLKKLRQRFAAIVDVESEVQKMRSLIDQLGKEEVEIRSRLAKEEAETRSKHAAELATLNANYTKAKDIFESLSQQVSALEENLEDISYGVYKPHFSFETSEAYKACLESTRAKRKALIKAGQATRCPVEWNVGGSKKEGNRMMKQYSKLMLRAFNGEADSAIAKVSWNNITKMEERIQKAWDAINDLGSTMQMFVTSDYLKVCQEELRLEFELEDKKYQEQEEQRKIRERLREEEKAQREYDRAQREAEQDEVRYQKALDKARSEISGTTGKELTDLNEKIALLEQRVKEAEETKQRAISMAQQTRCGYIYVISNHGTMGEEILKIGMTRRLDPMDRIRELSDASVPFGFDVHAMVYSEDAPTLEAELHSHFADYRVNLVNLRREFFRVSLERVAEFIAKKDLKAELAKSAEAREYRETLALIKQRTEKASVVAVKKDNQFPESLLAANS